MRKFIILIFFIIISVVTFLLQQTTYSTEKFDHECSKCHKLSNDEASKVLKEVIPDIKVLEVNQSPLKGVWEINAETKGKKALYYVDFSKKLVIAGSIFNIKTKANLTQERYLEINKVDVSQIPLEDTLIMGEKDAKHRVIVFTDPD
jgi:thiol:disulfide interchange protein DsbC